MNVIRAEDAAAEIWDVVVVGTGIGGGTVGHALAKEGWKVLFCEQGRCTRPVDGFLEGAYAETFLPGARVPVSADHATLRRAGRSIMTITDTLESSNRDFIPFIGSGAGGSSALYGMAMERFFPDDFHPRKEHPADCGASWREDWPISYDELEPFYAHAERLYGVRGERDPRRPDMANSALPAPPPASPHAEELTHIFKARGLNPYRLPLACDWVPECDNCQGFLCSRRCKRDSATACLVPAIQDWGAALIEECEVVSVIADRRAVRGVRCQVSDRFVELRGRSVVVAAGGLGSPALLLRSGNDFWPEGLANKSGLVGRNLMRHLIDLYAIKTDVNPAPMNGRKELAFSDFYRVKGMKLGGVQSFGRLPPGSVMFSALRNDVARGGWPWLATLMSAVKAPTIAALERLTNRYVFLAATVEDVPQVSNRVTAEARSGHVSMHYRVSDYDRKRVEEMRTLLHRHFAGLKWRAIRQSQNNQRIAHVCGTCRLGGDPTSSVVNADCRVHDLDNMFVVDASVFPSSAGTNPSLTIAALALRVAKRLTSGSSSAGQPS